MKQWAARMYNWLVWWIIIKEKLYRSLEGDRLFDGGHTIHVTTHNLLKLMVNVYFGNFRILHSIVGARQAHYSDFLCCSTFESSRHIRLSIIVRKFKWECKQKIKRYGFQLFDSKSFCYSKIVGPVNLRRKMDEREKKGTKAFSCVTNDAKKKLEQEPTRQLDDQIGYVQLFSDVGIPLTCFDLNVAWCHLSIKIFGSHVCFILVFARSRLAFKKRFDWQRFSN